MPRYSPNHVPQYQHHKASGKAVVKIAGRFRYLGAYDSQESRQMYAQVIAEWLASGKNPVVLDVRKDAAADPDAVNVEQVIFAFMVHAKGYYKDANGEPTSEVKNFIDALRTLRKLYGKIAATAFDAAKLEACQAEMIREGLARNTINRRINRIRQVIKYAAKKRMLPASVWVDLKTVDGLKRGRTEAKETSPVKPVAEEHARAAMRHAGPTIAAMIELQLLTGMRSGELIIMRSCDIDRSGPVWVYTPSKHKTQHHGHERIVYLGARCQEIITHFLKMNPTAYLFSPVDATEERFAAAAERRVTPRNAGNRRGTNRKSKPQRKPGDCYRDTSYAKAIARACDRAFPAPENATGDIIAAWKKEHRFHPH